MLLVLGRLTLPADTIGDFDRDLKAMLPRVLAEDGCRYYSLVPEDRAAGTVAVAEMWRDEAALIAHLQQPWILEFMASYGEKILESSVKVYDAANERDLPGS